VYVFGPRERIEIVAPEGFSQIKDEDGLGTGEGVCGCHCVDSKLVVLLLDWVSSE